MTMSFDPFRVLSHVLKSQKTHFKSKGYDLGGHNKPGHDRHHDWHHHHHHKHGGKGHDHDDRDDDHCDVPCFAAGTMITTIGGDCPVELVQPGDRVVTRDNGVQSVTWSGQVSLTDHQLDLLPELRPVMIRAGALNGIAPRRDTVVSPNHRVLIHSSAAQLLFGETEVLVAAHYLVGMPGIESVETGSVTYVHLMFDRHQIVLGDGAWSESFLPGDYMLGSMNSAQREEILTLFPDLEARTEAAGTPVARRALRRHEADLLVDLGV